MSVLMTVRDLELDDVQSIRLFAAIQEEVSNLVGVDVQAAGKRADDGSRGVFAVGSLLIKLVPAEAFTYFIERLKDFLERGDSVEIELATKNRKIKISAKNIPIEEIKQLFREAGSLA